LGRLRRNWRKKVDFKVPYVLAMREQAPQMFRELRQSGKLDEFLQERSVEAHHMLKELLAQRPKDRDGLSYTSDRRWAEEVVLHHFLDFHIPEKDQRPEPPDDLPDR
jgi:hypothetical protein